MCNAGTKQRVCVDRRHLGIAMVTTTFFRGLGGAIGAAALGAIFPARTGTGTGERAVRALTAGARPDPIGAVQTVLLVAVPIAASALLLVLRLHERPLGTDRPHPDAERASGAGQTDPARARAAP